MTSLQKLRQQRHAQWLCDLQQRIDHVLSQSVPGVSARPDQIYLFGSREHEVTGMASPTRIF